MAGPYERTLGGGLSKEAFIKLQGLVNRQAMISFKPRKEELMKKRLESFAQKDDMTYSKLIG